MKFDDLVSNYYEMKAELETEWRAMARTLHLWTETVGDHVKRKDYDLAWVDLRDMRSSVIKRFQRVSAIRSLLKQMEHDNGAR